MRRIHTSIACVFALFFMPSTAGANGTWADSRIPSAGVVRCFCATGDRTLYAGSDNGGLFRSPDNGRSWFHVDSFPSQCVYALEHRGPSLILAGTPDGMYRSEDGGNTWNGPLAGTADRIVLSILALSDSSFIAGCSKNGFLSSVDCGEHWKGSYEGNTVTSLTSDSDGTVAGISNGTTIFFLHIPDEAVRDSVAGIPGAQQIITLYFDRDSLLAGCADGVYSFSRNAKRWEKIVSGSWISGIVRLSDGLLYYASRTEGFFLWGEGASPWRKSDRRYRFPVSTMIAHDGTNVVLGGFDGRVAISDFSGPTNALQPPVPKTWENAIVNLTLPIDLGIVSGPAVGLALEIRPIPSASLEGMFLINMSVPRRLRFRIYPILPSGLYGGIGYFRYQKYGEQGMEPQYYHRRVFGLEFFAGFRLPRIVGFEVGWRESPQWWEEHYTYPASSPYEKTVELAKLNEIYLTVTFNLVNL